MLLCTAVPKVTATLFLMLPLNFTERLPDYRPPLPELRQPATPPLEDTLRRNYRRLLRIEVDLQRLEHQPGDHRPALEFFLLHDRMLREEVRKIKDTRYSPGAWLPLATPEELRELRGLPPVPRKVHD